MSVQLTKLKLLNFRSYQETSLGFDKSLTIIHGANGIGKTNLLEAISLLTPGRGLRNARLDDIARFGGSRQPGAYPGVPSRSARAPAGEQIINEWSVNAEIGGYHITTGLQRGLVKRVVKIDDEKQKGTSVLAEYVSCIWLTPQMDGIFMEGSGERRRFFDRIIYNFDPEHAARVAIYENAMRERLRLIKGSSADNTWLRVLERRMAEYGVAIAAARVEVIGYLRESLLAVATAFPRPEIEIDGVYEGLLNERSALEVEDIFAHDLLESRLADFRSGRTLAGVHKTDFHVVNTAKNMAASFCSTGEQKALLLSIIMGLARLLRERKNKTPIVLLDEVIAHLDESRRRELFAEIVGLGCQCFMTGTDVGVFSELQNTAKFINPG